MIKVTGCKVEATGSMSELLTEYAVATEALLEILSEYMPKQEAIESLVYAANLAVEASCKEEEECQS